MGYKRPLRELIERQTDLTSARIKLGRTREYAVQKAQIIQELIDRFTGVSSYSKDAWESVGRYQIVHIFTIENGDPEFNLGYVSQKSATIWDGYYLPIGEDSDFDLKQGRFIPHDEVIAQRVAELKFNNWTELSDDRTLEGEERMKKNPEATA